MSDTVKEVKEIIEFIKNEGDGLYSQMHEEELKDVIAKHIEYGTALVIRDKSFKEGIAVVARWNWQGEHTGLILDVVIKSTYRGYKFILQTIAMGISKNPECKYLVFERGRKVNSKMRTYKVSNLLKKRSI